MHVDRTRARRIGWSLLVLGLAALLGVRPSARAGNETKVTVPPVQAGKEKARVSAVEREEAALAFVRANHPELAGLLEPLKAMKPAQYEKAIAELYQVQKSLANLKASDPRRYEVALETWKARSRVQVLAAQLASTPGPELESQLRAALENQVDAQLKRQRLERALVQERLKSLDASIGQLESNRDALVASRYQALIKQGRRARRPDEGRSAPARPARTPGESKS